MATCPRGQSCPCYRLVVRRLPIGPNSSNVAAGGTRPRTQFGGASHSALSDRSDDGADRPFAGVAFNKMRSAAKPAARQAARDPTHVQHAGVENVSRSFPAHREPQQPTRFAPTRNNSFSGSKHGTFLMWLPSVSGRACTPTAAGLSSLKTTIHRDSSLHSR